VKLRPRFAGKPRAHFRRLSRGNKWISFGTELTQADSPLGFSIVEDILVQRPQQNDSNSNGSNYQPSWRSTFSRSRIRFVLLARRAKQMFAGNVCELKRDKK
jgi:hypothetical protein